MCDDSSKSRTKTKRERLISLSSEKEREREREKERDENEERESLSIKRFSLSLLFESSTSTPKGLSVEKRALYYSSKEAKKKKFCVSFFCVCVCAKVSSFSSL